MDQDSQNIVLISNLKNRVAYSNFNAIFVFLGQFAIRVYIIFQKGVDNFEIEHKTC